MTSKCDASVYNVQNYHSAADIFKERKIFIWGAGQKGRGFKKAMARNFFKVFSFIDSSIKIQNTKIDNIDVISPTNFFKNYNSSNSVVLTASVDSKNKEIGEILSKNNFKENRDFFSIQFFCPFYPTVEISGICNLRCSACIRADIEIIPNGKFMSFENYKKIIDKMIKDIPFLYLVDLYVWGEPILNKDLPKIIKYNNELGLASGLSTNLNNVTHLEKTIEAQPAQIRISCSGMSKETYEITHTGGKWPKFSKNVELLSKIIKKYNYKTNVEFYFHVYKHNIKEIKIAREMCDKNQFNFHPSLGIIFQEFMLEYSKTKKVNPKAAAAANLMVRDVDNLLDECKNEIDKNCILTRIVPVINWDMSVMPCCSYSYSELHPNYLDIEFKDLINKRTNSDVCLTCQDHGLHRWNNQVTYNPLLKKLEAQNT